MRGLITFLVLCGALGDSSMSAQVQPSIEPGARVRVVATDCSLSRQTATFEALRSDMLVVVTDSTVNCALSSITRLAVHRGRKRNLARGALWGGLIGAAVGVGFGLSMEVEDFNTGAFVLSGALAGVIIGAPVGAFIKSDRWEEVPLDQLRVSLAVPRNGRWGVGVSLVF